jgi:hypothetical protein
MDGRSLVSFLGDGPPEYVPRPVFSLSDACHASWREGSLKLILRDPASAHRAWHPSIEDAAGAVRVLPFLKEQHITDVSLPLCSRLQRTGEGAAESLGERAFLELYDLTADADEQHNLAADRSADVARLLSKLLGTLNATGLQSGALDPTGTAYTPEQVQELKAQGYWGFVAPTDDAGQEVKPD